MKKIIIVFGTRPEVIKLAPLIHALRPDFDVTLVATGQHNTLITPLLETFNLTPDYHFPSLKSPSLSDLTSYLLPHLSACFTDTNPDLVIIQGDTLSALSGALCATFHQLPIAHIESGLRSHNPTSPFPEETTRTLIDHMATYHFAPTLSAAENLYAENIVKNVYITGNTIIDAIQWVQTNHLNTPQKFKNYFIALNINIKKSILITLHRRENIGKPLSQILSALKTLARRFPDHSFVIPLHPNPAFQTHICDQLSAHNNIFLIEALDYPYFLYLLSQCLLVLTDSGGIQEEAPSFETPLFVLRETTERQEGITHHISELIGTDTENITTKVTAFLNNPIRPKSKTNPYGDGHAATRICDHLKIHLNK